MRAALLRAAAALPHHRLAGPRLHLTDLAVVVPALLLGALLAGLGTGGLLAGTGPATWLADESRGEIVRVDARGLAGARVAVGGAGDHLEVIQDGAHLVVVNRTSGEVTSIDLDGLLASGRRLGATHDGQRVIVHDGAWYAADRLAGSVARIDPITLQTTGRVWVSPEGLADATVDDAGTLWAVSARASATALTWTPAGSAGADSVAGGRFAVAATYPVPGADATARLVAHEVGATVVSAGSGTVVQVGTPTPSARHFGSLPTPVDLPARSPSSMVPITAGPSVLIVGSTGTATVSVADMQCTVPAAATVFDGIVYVPCRSGRVLRLGAEGRRVAADILAGDGVHPPTVVLGGDRVFVTVPGSGTGVQVLRDGRTLSFDGTHPRDPGDPATVRTGRPDRVAGPPADAGRSTARPTPPAANPKSTRTRPGRPTPTGPVSPPRPDTPGQPTPTRPTTPGNTHKAAPATDNPATTGRPDIGAGIPGAGHPQG